MIKLKTMRRALGVAAATGGLALTAAMTAAPAHAASPPVNLHTVYFGGGVCLLPDTNNWGSLVHASSCTSYSKQWTVEMSSDKTSFRLWWPSSKGPGCLIPNNEAVGQPVVVTNSANNAACNYPSAWWVAMGDGQIIDNHDGLALDYDTSGANRGLQAWKSIPQNTNQQFYGMWG